MHSTLVAIVTTFTLPAAAWPSLYERQTDGANYTSIFASGLSSGASIHFPSQADFNTSTVQRYSVWEEPTFAVTIKPATDGDVQLIVSGKQLHEAGCLLITQVRRANQNNWTFFATGGGHGAEPGFDTVDNAVNIDLSNFRQNDLDTTANTLTVGPGLSFFDFEEDLYNAGKLIRES